MEQNTYFLQSPVFEFAGLGDSVRLLLFDLSKIIWRSVDLFKLLPRFVKNDTLDQQVSNCNLHNQKLNKLTSSFFPLDLNESHAR